MTTRPANFFNEPPRQAFGRTPRVAFMLRIGSWLLTPEGLFRWTRYDFTAGGKPSHRHDWRRIRFTPFASTTDRS